MDQIVRATGMREGEFEGVGQSIDAAVLDAIDRVSRHAQDLDGRKAEVIAWGIRTTGAGGTRSFWARVRLVASS